MNNYLIHNPGADMLPRRRHVPLFTPLAKQPQTPDLNEKIAITASDGPALNPQPVKRESQPTAGFTPRYWFGNHCVERRAEGWVILKMNGLRLNELVFAEGKMADDFLMGMFVGSGTSPLPLCASDNYKYVPQPPQPKTKPLYDTVPWPTPSLPAEPEIKAKPMYDEPESRGWKEYHPTSMRSWHKSNLVLYEQNFGYRVVKYDMYATRFVGLLGKLSRTQPWTFSTWHEAEAALIAGGHCVDKHESTA